LNSRRLLAVLAHPDDESFGPGGTLALYARQGVEVSLVCATRGEVGNIPESIQDSQVSLGELREAELRCAAKQLGLRQIEFLNYRDSGMPGSEDNHHPQALAAAPVDEVAAKINDHMLRIDPQVVITFDPFGGYGHPDHIAIHQATVQAFHSARDRSRVGLRKLYFATFQRRIIHAAVRLLPLFGRNPRQWGRNKDIDMVEVTKVRFPTHARINIRSVLEVKRKAAKCHASQLENQRKQHWLLRLIYKLSQGVETFMRGYPEATAKVRESDLFAGIEEYPAAD
jgi:LmbE family N-acetylglucosaminyl deacetylase